MSDKPFHLFNLRLPLDVWERVRNAARAEGTSVHGYLLRAVTNHLDRDRSAG